MKRLGRVFFAGVILSLVLLFGIAEAADKFAYVDLTRIFAEYSKTKDYDKVLSDKETTYTSERDKKVEEVKKMQEKMNLLSDKEKEKKKTEFEAKVKDLQSFDREKQTDLRKDQDDKMKELLKDIEAAVRQHAEKEGYTMVFNDRVLIYQNKSMDITDKIIEILNKGQKSAR